MKYNHRKDTKKHRKQRQQTGIWSNMQSWWRFLLSFIQASASWTTRPSWPTPLLLCRPWRRPALLLIMKHKDFSLMVLWCSDPTFRKRKSLFSENVLDHLHWSVPRAALIEVPAAGGAPRVPLTPQKKSSKIQVSGFIRPHNCSCCSGIYILNR